MSKKRNKVFFNKGLAYQFDADGKKKNVESLDEANAIQSKCCGIDCCNNRIVMPVNDADGVTTYPAFVEIVYVGGVFKWRVTATVAGATVVKEINFA